MANNWETDDSPDLSIIPSMAISLTYTLPLIEFTYPINPLDKEKPTLPQMVGIGHVCHLPLRFPTAHKVIKTLQCRDLLRLVAIKNSLRERARQPPPICPHNTSALINILQALGVI